MKGALVTEGGVQLVSSLAEPEPVEGEILVDVQAAALNHRDLLVVRGEYGYPLPLVPGSDAAGTRADTGEPVVVLPALGWGESEVAPARTFQLLGGPRDGTLAARVAVPAGCVFARPAHLNWAEAATLGVAGLTAFRALHTRAALQRGETVLVLGAGSGVATFAIQLAAAAGGTVLVTSSSQERLERARVLGAQGGVLRSEPDWPRLVRKLNGGRGVDVVIDGVGSTLAESLAACRAGGRVVAVGAVGGASATIPVEQLYRNTAILGTAMGSPREFARLLELVARTGLRPAVDSVWPMDELPDALARLASGLAFGKVVVTIGDQPAGSRRSSP